MSKTIEITANKLKLGTNLDIPNHTYHSDREYQSSSTLKLALKSLREYYKKYIKNDGFKSLSSDALDLGSYIHSRILEPELTEAEFAVYDGRRAGDDYNNFKSKHGSKTIIKQSQLELANELCDMVKQHKHAPTYLSSGTPEYTYCTIIDGVKVKVRADWINLEKGYILDVKTTSAEMTTAGLQKVISGLDYDLSAALYVDCLSEIHAMKIGDMEKLPAGGYSTMLGDSMDFYFLFVGTKTKEVLLYKASKSLLDNGRRKYKAALKKLTIAQRTNVWDNVVSDEVPEIDHAEWGVFNG